MAYAEGTSVSVERSRAEVERILHKYGADQFLYGVDQRGAMVAFRAKGRSIRFVVPFPSIEDFRKTSGRFPRHRPLAAREAAREVEVRRRWRALSLAIKAKLEAVASGIATFEVEFMPYTMLANGKTVAEALGPEVERALAANCMPQVAGFLPAPKDGGA
jgi:hypothetical protein